MMWQWSVPKEPGISTVNVYLTQLDTVLQLGLNKYFH